MIARVRLSWTRSSGAKILTHASLAHWNALNCGSLRGARGFQQLTLSDTSYAAGSGRDTPHALEPTMVSFSAL
jgi:hypothetical protein